MMFCFVFCLGNVSNLSQFLKTYRSLKVAFRHYLSLLFIFFANILSVCFWSDLTHDTFMIFSSNWFIFTIINLPFLGFLRLLPFSKIDGILLFQVILISNILHLLAICFYTKLLPNHVILCIPAKYFLLKGVISEQNIGR